MKVFRLETETSLDELLGGLQNISELCDVSFTAAYLARDVEQYNSLKLTGAMLAKYFCSPKLPLNSF